jgi:hypothetical protein
MNPTQTKHRRDAGFSLSALMFFAAAASILIAAAVPSYQMQAKREMEAELIFRGEEYTRAIQKYQRKFGVYPTSVDQLVSTNGLRFLRRAYTDPITGKEFRQILINPDGSLTGSKVFAANVNSQSLFGNTSTAGNTGNTTSGANNNPANNNPANNNPANNNPANNNPRSPGAGNNTNANSPFNTGNTGFNSGFTTGANPGLNSATNPRPNTGTAPSTTPRTSGTTTTTTFNGSTTPFRTGAGTPQPASGGIIGVASDSSKESIKIYNNRQKYDEWEFVAILNQQGNNPNGPNPPQTGPGTGGGTKKSPTGPNPFSTTPSPTPFGPAPGNPFPTGAGTTPPPNFGLGNTTPTTPRK